jgi:hypothetical protein
MRLCTTTCETLSDVPGSSISTQGDSSSSVWKKNGPAADSGGPCLRSSMSPPTRWRSSTSRRPRRCRRSGAPNGRKGDCRPQDRDGHREEERPPQRDPHDDRGIRSQAARGLVHQLLGQQLWRRIFVEGNGGALGGRRPPAIAPEQAPHGPGACERAGRRDRSGSSWRFRQSGPSAAGRDPDGNVALPGRRDLPATVAGKPAPQATARRTDVALWRHAAWIYHCHCHILEHHAAGMMDDFEVVR